MLTNEQTQEELHSFYIRVDSLLSLLVHRHGKYLDNIKEKDEATELYLMARTYSKNKKII